MSSNGVATLAAVHASPMMSMVAPHLDRDKLAQWVREKSDARMAKSQCVLFSLSHAVMSERGSTSLEPVTEFGIPKKSAGEERDELVLRLCEEFDQASQNIAGVHPKLQRFIVGAHVRDNRDEHPIFQYVFLVTPPPEMARAFDDSEGASPVGLLGHMSRLLDTCVRQLAVNLQQDKDRLVDEKRDLMKHIEVLEKDRWEMRVKCEELLDSRALRDIQVHKTRMEMEMEHKLYSALADYGIRIASKYLGDSSPNPMIDFAKTLEPAQLLGLIDSMSDEQKKAFEPLMPVLVSAMNAEKKAELAGLIQARQGTQLTGGKKA